MQLSFQFIFEVFLLSKADAAEQMNRRPDALYIFRVFSDTGCVLAVQEKEGKKNPNKPGETWNVNLIIDFFKRKLSGTPSSNHTEF